MNGRKEKYRTAIESVGEQNEKGRHAGAAGMEKIRSDA